MMLANEGHKALGQADEADAQGALIDDTLDGIGGLESFTTRPQ